MTAGANHLQLISSVSGDLEAALERGYAPAETELLRRVLAWIAPQAAQRSLGSGESLWTHAINTALTLRDFKLDAAGVAASLLAHFAESNRQVIALRSQFGAEIAELAHAVSRMAMIDSLLSNSTDDAQRSVQLEGLRKMLLAMAQDVSGVLIKLADHTQSMRFLVKSVDEPAARLKARLTFDIFAPLANRLGVWQLKWELEDLALRILEPETYKQIARLLDEKRASRERYIEDAISKLESELALARIGAQVSGRPKHIYSIYSKMQRKAVDFEAVYDVRAVRVLVEGVKDCYAVLAVVHSVYAPVAEEFDDYIAKPKKNGYRSLHTAVIGPGGRPLEIQIRTYDMHQAAELGVAAHWRYKERSARASAYDGKIAWLRDIVEWKDQVAQAPGVPLQLANELFADAIYVLTPQGRVIELPKDSTPIDFAYHVHTELGHRCRSARVDGAMVPLNTALTTGQQVEIISGGKGGPSRDWLNPVLGYARSSGARGKIRQWFNRQNFEASVAHGRIVVDKELHRVGATGKSLDSLARELGYDKLDEFLADVARGEIGPRQLQTALRGGSAREPAGDEQPIVGKTQAKPGGILVVGVDKLLTVPAKCCKPVPPDAIVGFVSRGRGVTIHRKTCRNVALLAAERLVEADWGTTVDSSFAVEIIVEATDRKGLLRDITEILSREGINVTATNTVSRGLAARMHITLEINHLTALNRVLALIREVPGVAVAQRH